MEAGIWPGWGNGEALGPRGSPGWYIFSDVSLFVNRKFIFTNVPDSIELFILLLSLFLFFGGAFFHALGGGSGVNFVTNSRGREQSAPGLFFYGGSYIWN